LVTALQTKFNLTDTSPLAILDRCLDEEMVNFYLTGQVATEIRYLFYAIRWHYVLTNVDLPLANASRIGLGRATREAMRDPMTWEEVVLLAKQLLLVDGTAARVGLETAILSLLEFDTYARPSEWLGVQADHLLKPIRGADGMAACWSVTFFPATGIAVSKTRCQDDTIGIGVTSVRRLWLNSIVKQLKLKRHGQLLFTLTLANYEKSFKQACVKAQLPPSVPHQLRHGGASLDSMNGTSEVVIMGRGRWASLASVQRYRKPGRYLRRLALLTSFQVESARAAENFLQVELPKRIRVQLG
jgi:integrase